MRILLVLISLHVTFYVSSMFFLEDHLFLFRLIFFTLCSWWLALELYFLPEGIWSLSGAQKSLWSLLSPSIFSLVQVPLFLPSFFTSSQDKEPICELNKHHAYLMKSKRVLSDFLETSTHLTVTLLTLINLFLSRGQADELRYWELYNCFFEHGL